MKKTLFQQVLGVASSAAVLSIPAAVAADVSWDNPGTGSFTVDTNWNTDVVPGNTDNAFITNGGTATITTGDTVSVNRLIIDNGTVTQTGGSVTTVKHGNFETPGDYAIGSVAGQSGTYNVSGASALNGGRVRIGYNGGTGTMTFGNTSVYTGVGGVDTWVGNGAGSVGSLSITDSAQWKIDGDWFVVGRSGSTGTLTMSGTSKVSIATGGNIVLADGGTATVNLSNSAEMSTAGEAWLGNADGGNGTITLSDSSKISASNWFVVGRAGGTGTVTVQDNAQLVKTGSNHFIIGDQSNSVGTLTVKGNAAVSSNNELWIGNSNNTVTGTLNLESGSVTAGSWIAVGRDQSKGTLNMSGGVLTKNGNGSVDGAELTGTNFVTLGNAANVATVNHSGGTINNTTSVTVLSEAGVSRTNWTATGGTANLGDLRIGFSGQATMTLDGTANYTATTVYIGSNGSSTGNVLNLNGGKLRARFIEEGAGSGSINFNGGVVQASEDRSDFLADFEDGDLNIQAGGLIFDTDGHNVTITQALAGVGGLVKQGAGTLNLSSQGVAYLGDTVVEGGTLTIHTTFLADDSDVYLTAGSVLNLDFVAVDSINRLFIDGIMMAAGTWGGIASGADYETALIAGDGLLLVAVPEPSHYAMGVVVLLGLAIVARRRRCHA
jgi:hypothetical protein